MIRFIVSSSTNDIFSELQNMESAFGTNNVLDGYQIGSPRNQEVFSPEFAKGNFMKNKKI